MGNPKQEDVKKQMVEFKEWVEKQPNFSKDLDDKILIRFLHSCYYDIEKAKTAIELFFSIRSSAPELFNNRDPCSSTIKNYLSIVNLASYKISGNRNLWIWQLNDPGLDRYDYVTDAKIFMLMTDAWFLDNDFLEDADFVLLDVKDVSLKFLTKFNLSVARKIAKYQEDAIPIRLKQIHIINAPPFIDKVYMLMKPLLKKDMTDMIRFHTPKSTTIYDFIDKNDLPEDYGGSQPNMEHQMKSAIELLGRQRDKLTDYLWRVEKKSKNKSDATETVPTFRSLAID